MHNLTIAQQIKGLKNKDFSSEELTQHYLNRIHDSKLNAFISVTDDIAPVSYTHPTLPTIA